MTHDQIVETALCWHRDGKGAALATVVETWGSAPRQPGSQLAISGAGQIMGSVSGGCVEDDLIARIREGGVSAACATNTPTVLRYGISADEAHRFGLPCGGTVELVLEPVSAHSRLDELLRQSCSVNFRALDLAARPVVLTSMVGVGVTAIPELCAGRPTLRIWCDGTYGHYLWETLLDIAGDLGGGAVVARSID